MGNPGKPIMDTSRMSASQQRRRRRERIGVDPKCEELARYFHPISTTSRKTSRSLPKSSKLALKASSQMSSEKAHEGPQHPHGPRVGGLLAL